MTEDEAKTKWCPFARVQCEDNRAAFNRLIGAKEATDEFRTNFETILSRCIGSKCMAWRWEPPIGDKRDIRLTKRPGEEPKFEDMTPPTHGYCGLAGK